MLTKISASAIMLPLRLPAIVQKAAATIISVSMALMEGFGHEAGAKASNISPMPQTAATSAV